MACFIPFACNNERRPVDMAPIFASADIAALVAAFPPPWPTKERPSLVRSLSGNNLADSRKVSARFRVLLETAPSRIRLIDIPSKLNVGKADWLLDYYDGPLYYTRDGLSLIPRAQADDILHNVEAKLHDGVVSVPSLISDADVSEHSMNSLLVNAPFADDIERLDGDDKRYLYSRSYAARLGLSMKSAINNNGAERIDLTQRFPDVPMALLKTLADDVASGVTAEGITEILNDRVVFVPSDYMASLEKQQHEDRDRQVQDAVDRLHGRDFYRLPGEPAGPEGQSEFLQAVKERFEDQFGVSVIEVTANDGSLPTLILPSRLNETMETLRLAAPQEAANLWHKRDGSESTPSLTSTALESLAARSSSEIATLLLRSSYRTGIESIVTGRISQLHDEDEKQASQRVRERLLAPVALYAEGLATVTEATLKQHLTEYLGEHFRREAIPVVTTTLRDERLLIDKSRKRDVEKMQQACAEAKTLSDVHTAVSKLARKQKITPPDHELLRRVKHQTLQQKAKAMRKMTRGSDLLQNLLWITMAQNRDGLFMSSGKDTTRMLKEYRSIGDAEIARKLEAWRDMLKAGREQKDDLEEMRKVAMKVAEGMCGTDGPSQDGGSV